MFLSLCYLVLQGILQLAALRVSRMMDVRAACFGPSKPPWLTVIPGRLGRIFPWGGHLLAAYTAARPARRALEILDGVTVRQGGTVGDKTSSEIIIVARPRIFRKQPQKFDENLFRP